MRLCVCVCARQRVEHTGKHHTLESEPKCSAELGQASSVPGLSYVTRPAERGLTEPRPTCG